MYTNTKDDFEKLLEEKEATYTIISKVAYLIGVPRDVFDNPRYAANPDIFRGMDKNKTFRIVRNLSVLRTQIQHNFGKINKEMQMGYKTINSLPEYISPTVLQQLTADGIKYYKKTKFLPEQIIEINRLLSDRINNCKDSFPDWIKWEYIRDLFVMPNGTKADGAKEAANLFFKNLEKYPHSCYINWIPGDDGYILANDKKFLTLLYEKHNDYFGDFSKVSNVTRKVRSNIYDFVDSHNNVVMVVDCENSDAYQLASTLKNLEDELAGKISKIILFDDVHTATAWRILEEHTSIPVEHTLIERVKYSKSLVDIELTARTCREFYVNNADAFVIVSSDSDYWGLIRSLPEAEFLMLVQRDAVGMDLKEALKNKGIFYAYIDDFYDGDCNDLKMSALFRELYRQLDEAISLNIYTMYDNALTATRVNLSPNEKQRILEKHIKHMALVIDEDGNVRIELKR